MSIIIPLTKGYETVVSDEDADLAEFKWYPCPTKTTGAIIPMRSYGTRLNHHTVKLSRVIGKRILERELRQDEFIDHIDGNTLNNCRSNLRLATCSENGMNSKRRKDNKTGYKGVGWHKDKKKFRASILVNGHQKHLGYYDSAELAYDAYCKAASVYYGEFARFE